MERRDHLKNKVKTLRAAKAVVKFKSLFVPTLKTRDLSVVLIRTNSTLFQEAHKASSGTSTCNSGSTDVGFFSPVPKTMPILGSKKILISDLSTHFLYM